VSKTAIATDLSQPLDIHVYFTTKIALDHIVAVDVLTEANNLILVKVLHLDIRLNLRRIQDLFTCATADAVDVGQGNYHMLVTWDVYARNTCHGGSPFSFLPLPLLVLRIAAQYIYRAATPHDLAVITHSLY
jgi:hypothetical protein